MKVDYVEETSVRKALNFEIEPEVVAAEIDKCTRQYAKKVKLPGFRAGKIPPAVVKQRFHRAILDDVAETLVNRIVPGEIRDRGLKPVAAPEVKELDIAEGKPLTFRAIFETMPLLDAPDWRGLEVNAPSTELTDEEVAKELEGLREGAARFEPIEPRPVAEGDFVVLDARRRPADGGEEQRNVNAMLEVGSDDNPSEINAALPGMSIGDTKTVTVAPTPREGETAGTGPGTGGSEYTFTLNEIKAKVLPDLDDEFAKDLGDWDTLEALTSAIRERLQAQKDHDADRAIRNALIEALVTKADFEVPEAMVEHHMTVRAENTIRGLAGQGIDPARVGIDWREYREQQREHAGRAARADLIIDEIAKRESIQVLDAELDSELDALAARMEKPREALRAQMAKGDELMALRRRIRESKVLDLIKANAKLVSA